MYLKIKIKKGWFNMIRFNKFYNHFNILSSLLIILSLLLLFFKGLNFGIDFKGGTLIELRSSNVKINVTSLRENTNPQCYRKTFNRARTHKK